MVWAEGEYVHEYDPNDPSEREEFTAASVRRGLLVHEFSSSEHMERSAALVSKDGYAVGGSNYTWIGGHPRFYGKDRIIVLYLGGNEQIINFLEEALGEPFAGAS